MQNSGLIPLPPLGDSWSKWTFAPQCVVTNLLPDLPFARCDQGPSGRALLVRASSRGPQEEQPQEPEAQQPSGDIKTVYSQPGSYGPNPRQKKKKKKEDDGLQGLGARQARLCRARPAVPSQGGGLGEA